MPIELRILSGSRAGQRQTFDQPAIKVGRQSTNDLRFDPQIDLDVSGHHAELGESGGRWTITDRGSTNGTFVNGTRTTGPTPLKSGDVVSFGKTGPQVEVRVSAGAAPPPAPTRVAPGAAPGSAPSLAGQAARQRSSTTGERVRQAVKHETRHLKRILAGVVVLVAVLATVGVWFSRHQSAAAAAAYTKMVVDKIDSIKRMELAMGPRADSSAIKALQRTTDSLERQLKGSHSDAEYAALLDSIKKSHGTPSTSTASGIDNAAISQQNDPAVAFLRATIAGRDFGATAFCINSDGTFITNRHAVRDAAGTNASAITLVFNNTELRIRAHIVRVSSDSLVDLALIKIDDAGRYPVVRGISRLGVTRPGIPIVTIGYPAALDLTMAGDTISASLTSGLVSRVIPGTLQVNAYATEGSSGSPVFDASGYVVGVIYGGPKGANGQITYAVPSDKVAEFLRGDARGIVK